MKIFLPLLFLLCDFQFVLGQITIPVTKANFGIDADLSSNFFSNLPQPAGDDWFSKGLTGTGQSIIDTTGAASIVAGYTNNPASRNWSFSKLMRQAPFSIVNNRLVLDAIFHRDFHGNDSTVFATGSNKNGMTPASWNCPESQGIPDKNDILDAFTHVRRAGPNITDSLWMFAGISLENTTGSRYFDFELYQSDIAYNRNTLTFSGYGPDAGHTSWTFDSAGNINSPGDIIFTAEFGSSTLTLVEARIWIKKASLSITPKTFNWGGSFDGDGAGAEYGYANILPKTAGAFYAGIQNTIDTWAGPFSLVRVDNSMVTDYIARQFMEFSVNLTKLGIEPASFSNNACGSPFRRVLIKTRSSTSFTAELKDFIAPFKMFDYTQVDANAFLKYFCGTMPTTPINVYNPVATSIYNWTTTNGNIVGSATGPTINVNAPGTYFVTQQLNAQCPSFAMDSVTILFQATCTVLDVDFREFNASQIGKEAALNWQVKNNELAENYTIEYSTDNRVFNELATLSVNKRTGEANYTFRYQLNSKQSVHFYRVRVIGKNGVTKYSNSILLRSANENRKTPLVFPNPLQGEAWLSMESSEKTIVNVYVSDMSGRLIKTLNMPLKKGYNLLPLYEMPKQATGLYILRVKSIDGDTTQKLILKK